MRSTLACTPRAPLTSATAACASVCDGAPLLCQHIPQSDGSSLAALQPRPQPSNPFIPKYPGTVPGGQDRATSQARFMTPFVLQSGRTLLTWWMEWQDRRLYNHPRGIKNMAVPHRGALERGWWRLEGNQRTVLGAQPLADEWMAGCTRCIWLWPKCV